MNAYVTKMKVTSYLPVFLIMVLFSSTAASQKPVGTSRGNSTITGPGRPFFNWLNARRIAAGTCSGTRICSACLVTEA